MKKKRIAYKSDPGFKVPDNYFEEFETEILNAISQPTPLSNYKGNPGFAVPQNYFEATEDNVLEKVRIHKPGGEVIPLFRKRNFYYAVGIAAVFIGIVSTVLFRSGPEFSINTIELSAIESYIDEGIIDLDLNEISSFIFEEDYVLNDLYSSNLNDEELFNYLSENIEYSDLLEE